MAEKEIFLQDYKAPAFLIPNIDMLFEIFDEEVLVTSELSLKRNDKREEKDLPLILDGRDLIIQEILLNGNETEEYTYENNLLTLKGCPDEFTLTTKVKIDPFNNKSMEGFYKSGEILCSQNEAEGFRRITFFPDRPDVMSKFTVSIEADKQKYPFLLANGNPVAREERDNGRHFVKWEDPFAKPSYLMAIVAGDLELTKDTFTTQSGREVSIEFYTDPGKGKFCDHAVDSLKRSMKWDEETFGLEYDLDIYMVVAVDSFNMGAMENKGLNIFNSSCVLADPETATDSDFMRVEGVIGHEYFHNWTGNRVTCRDWFQLTLKEGLTVFRDQEFSSDMTDRTVKRIDVVDVVRAYQFAEAKGPNSHPIRPESYIEIDNFYTVTIYEKGSEVIRMIHTLIGKENFRKGIDLYFERFDGMAVTTDDFVQSMQDASGMDLTQFKRWYSQASTPELKVESSFQNGEYTLTFTQELPESAYKSGNKEPLVIPVNLGLYTHDGKDVTPEEYRKIILKENIESFTFKTEEEPVPSILQGYSAPVVVNYNYSDRDLITLLSHDRDNFNRYDAARRLALGTMVSMAETIKKGEEVTIDDDIIAAYKAALNNSELDKFYLSRLISVPELTALADKLGCDYQLAHITRKTYLKTLASELEEDLLTLYNSNKAESFELNNQAMGQRAVKNMALGFLSHLEGKYTALAKEQFDNAHNMTDYMAAFACLQRGNEAARKAANKAYHDKWKDNFLVMNKWFAVQAMRDDENVLEDVQELEKHILFDSTNPNMLRSLYSSFSRANLPAFHKADGSGYKYLADKIIEIDTFNSHSAAGLANSFQKYQYLPDGLRKVIKKELERILAKENISSGLYEIVSKTLKTRD